jgi:hypothetical protein
MNSRENRWTYAVPVRRAWRVNRRIEIKNIAPNTYTHDRARVIASRGELMTEQEVVNALRLPVTPVNVFGEPPVATEATEFQMEAVFRPSRGLTPSFGLRSSDYEDGEHCLYMLQMDGDIGALLGRRVDTLNGKSLVKIGFSRPETPAR